MKKIIYLIVIILSFSSLYAKKIDRDSIQIDQLDPNEEFFNNLQSIRTELEEKDFFNFNSSFNDVFTSLFWY